jgi:hypothetical protein
LKIKVNQTSLKSKEDQQQQKPRTFSTNLSALLNDPKKDRTKIAYLFTKTWGNEFVDSATAPSIQILYPSAYASLKQINFSDFVKSIAEVRLNFFLYFKNKIKNNLFNVFFFF